MPRKKTSTEETFRDVIRRMEEKHPQLGRKPTPKESKPFKSFIEESQPPEKD